jgi:hypothetical protein
MALLIRPVNGYIDFSLLRAAGLRSFGTLENALRFLAAPGEAQVYPPPREAHRQAAPATGAPHGKRSGRSQKR